MNPIRFPLLLIVAAISCGALDAEDITVKDGTGGTYRFIEGGRYIRGFAGGERRLERAFPLSTLGQFYGNAERPAHVTWITRPFYIATREVTVAQFREFVQATKHKTSAETGKTEMVGWSPTPEDKPLYESFDFDRHSRFTWQSPGFDQDEDHPVVGVSWSDAKAFCVWLSERDGETYRLPTEAEWELACRAGTATWFSFGDQAAGIVHQHGNLGNVELENHRKHAAERHWLLDWDDSPGDGHIFTAPAGSYQPNPRGLHDMHGNVWEWCEDLWLDTSYNQFERDNYNTLAKTAVDPIGTERQTEANEFHSIRGGSWYNGDVVCRSSGRSFFDREDAACYVGFRVVREASGTETSAAKKSYEREVAAKQAIEAAGGILRSSDGVQVQVHFEGKTCDPKALEFLRFLPELEHVRIAWRDSQNTLDQSSIEVLSNLKSLKHLDFSASLEPESLDLTPLTKLKSLNRLSFGRACPLGDKSLRELSLLQSLESFSCYGTSGMMTDEGVRCLKSNRQLRELEVHETRATGTFLRDFAGCPLERLAITKVYNLEGTFENEHLPDLARFTNLTALDLQGQALLDARLFKAIEPLRALRTLSLDGCTALSDKDFLALASLHELIEVQLRDCGAGDTAATAIGRLPRIERVKLSSDSLSDKGFQAMAKAFTIIDLEVASDLLTDACLASLGRINRLKELELRSDKITGSAFGPLCRLPEIRTVSLITSALEDVAFEHFGAAKTITKLRLAHQGFEPPAALTDAGLMKIQRAIQLKELWLPRNGTRLTEAGMDALKKASPSIGVIPYTVSYQKGDS